MRKKYGKTLQDSLKYRIVWIVMKLKQIIVSLIVPVVAISALAALSLPATPARALTDSQKKACYEKWAGRTSTGTNGTTKYNEANFKKDDCASNKNGSCKIVRYNDGATLHCQRSDGKYDNGSAGFGGTDGGSDTGDTGDDGTDTPITSSNVDGDDCGGVKTAIIKCDAKNSGDLEDNGVWALLIIALNVLTAGVGIIAIAGIVYGAVLYTTAEDKADQVKKATDIITNVVIGLIAFALMWAGLNFIVPGGVFA